MPLIKNVQFLILILLSQSCCAVSEETVVPISEIQKIIVQNALYPLATESLTLLNKDNLAEGLRSFDSYARYIPPPLASKKVSSSLHLGLDLFLYKSRIWVTPEPGGPASQYGIPEVGELRGINDRLITNNLEQTSTLIDEAINDNRVILDIFDGQDKKYSVKPEAFKTSSVTTRTIGQDVFIRISDFISHGTAPFFSGLHKTIDKSGSNIIIDLRGCPGGDLFEALEIAGMFVPAGLPLLTTYNRTGKIHSYISPTGKKLSAPLYILIDNRTASSAEILAGILKSHAITRIVGEKSYGKCESQTVFNLSNGGTLWLTTLSIQFADGTSCTHTGVKPDIIYPDISIARSASIKNKIDKK